MAERERCAVRVGARPVAANLPPVSIIVSIVHRVTAPSPACGLLCHAIPCGTSAGIKPSPPDRPVDPAAMLCPVLDPISLSSHSPSGALFREELLPPQDDPEHRRGALSTRSGHRVRREGKLRLVGV